VHRGCWCWWPYRRPKQQLTAQHRLTDVFNFSLPTGIHQFVPLCSTFLHIGQRKKLLSHFGKPKHCHCCTTADKSQQLNICWWVGGGGMSIGGKFYRPPAEGIFEMCV
jgi:hypothetical protein